MDSKVLSPAVEQSEGEELCSIRAPRRDAEVDVDLAAATKGRRLGFGARPEKPRRPQPRPSIISDGPALEDRMGFHPAVRALCDITLSSATETPLAIGLDGPWGSGKTSMLRMVELQARILGFSCIWLNAWSLERSEQLVASVTSGIQDEIRKMGQSGAFKAKLSTFFAKGLASLVPDAIGGQAVRGLLGTNIASRRIAADVSEVASIASTRNSFAELIGLLLDNLSASSLPVASRRLVVLIDDLDRALPDQIATILRNLKLVLDVPRCVFLLAMDMRLVAQSIENFYRNRNAVGAISVRTSDASVDIGSDKDGIPVDFGMSYLEKLVQIRIPVPRLSRRAALDYLRDLGIAEEVAEIVSWAPAQDIENPRRLKRYLNTLSLTLNLIMACSLPEGINNVFALRALALRRDHRSLYDGLVGGTDPHSVRWPEADADNWAQTPFVAYVSKITSPPGILAGFEAFVRETRLFET
jgi:hypothetical protein